MNTHRPNKKHLFIIALSTSAATLLGIVLNVASNALPDSLKNYIWLSWPVAILLFLITVALTIWQIIIERENGDDKSSKKLEVFISYCRKDRKWVTKELVPKLKSIGLSTCLINSRTKRENNIANQLRYSLDSGEKVLIVLTTAYLLDEWDTFLNISKTIVKVSGFRSNFIVLQNEKCVVPSELSSAPLISFTTNQDVQINWIQLFAAIRPLVTKFKTPGEINPREDFGGVVEADRFYGRDSEIISIKQWILDQKARLIMVLGLGGIGKTSLTKMLIHQVKFEFRQTSVTRP